MTTIYRPRNVIPDYVPQNIAAAYAAAGIDRPTPPEQLIEKALRELPTAAAVGHTIVAEAHDGPQQSPAKFATDARRRMAEAIAADALRDAWGRHGRNATTARLPRATDQAAEDLSGAFSATVEALRDAAANLAPQSAAPGSSTLRAPSGHPAPGPVSLDAEAAVARDAGAALTTARAELAKLATFAGITAAGPLPNSAASGLAPLVPVIAIEGAVMERCVRSVGEGLTVTNEAQLGVTRAVRRLAADARTDVDAAVLGIAHGNYRGVTLRLNDAAANQATREAIGTAFERSWTDDGQGKPTGRPFAVLV